MDDRNHDYQNEMSVDTRAIDTAGEEAAEAVNVTTAPVGERHVAKRVGNQTHIRDVGTFGVLAPMEIGTEYAQERMLFFKELMIETARNRAMFNPLRSGKLTAAYSSQQKLAKAYLHDITAIQLAQRQYDLLRPPALMAARSFAKLHELGTYLGFSDKTGPHLSPVEQRAISRAAKQAHTRLASAEGLEAAQSELIIERMALESAAQTLASEASSHTVDALYAELETAKADKAKVEAKIKRAEKIVKALGSAAAMVAGGAGAMSWYGIGGTPVVAGTALEAEAVAGSAAAEVETAASTADVVGKWAGTTKTAASAGAGPVAFGVGLLYEQSLTHIEAKIAALSPLIAADNRERRQAAISAAWLGFTAAHGRYGLAAQRFEARMNDRRKAMAHIGSRADRVVSASGGNSRASDAMLWAASLAETRPLLGTAVDIGRDAASSVDSADKQLRTTRSMHWGTLDDVAAGDSTPRREPLQTRDAQVLRAMRRQVDQWLEGAVETQAAVTSAAERDADTVLELAGMTAAY